MKTTILATQAFVLAISIMAGVPPAEAGSLLGQIVKTQTRYDFNANLQAMTPTGIKKLQEFKGALADRDKGLWAKWGEEQMAFLRPYAGGRGNFIHFMETKADGTVVQSAFETPQILLTPKSTQVNLRYRKDFADHGVGFHHEIETNAGLLKWSQIFRVEPVNGRSVRIQTREIKDTPQMKSDVTYEPSKGTLEISVTNHTLDGKQLKHHLRGSIALEEGELGKVIGFNMSSNGSMLHVFHLKDGEVTERLHALVPESKEKGEWNGAWPLIAEKRGAKKLEKNEIERLGFFKAESKTYAGRKDAPLDQTARGLEVRGYGKH